MMKSKVTRASTLKKVIARSRLPGPAALPVQCWVLSDASATRATVAASRSLKKGDGANIQVGRKRSRIEVPKPLNDGDLRTAVHIAVKKAQKYELSGLTFDKSLTSGLAQTNKDAVKHAQKNSITAESLVLGGGVLAKTAAKRLSPVEIIARQAILSAYKYDRLKPKETQEKKEKNDSTPKKTPPGPLKFHTWGGTRIVDDNAAIAYAVNDARTLGNLREDEGTPQFYAEWALKNIVHSNAKKPSVKVTDHLSGAQLEKRGLRLLHGVGRGSVHEPHLMVMEYIGAPRQLKKSVALVGKGVTFDSGGQNVKPYGSMETMHLDMMGAGAVLGTMKAIADLQPAINVVAVVALAENMIGPESYNPSSIITSLKGTTVEITNTDAEGRLVLADALTFLQRDARLKSEPSTIIDLATLTGAMVVALGSHRAGVFGNNANLVQNLVLSGVRVDERVWPMPIGTEHHRAMKGTQSNLVNCAAGREGGACSAAAFLEHFVEDGKRWAHLDIAGPAMFGKPTGVQPAGATGFGVQLLCDFLLRRVSSQHRVRTG